MGIGCYYSREQRIFLTRIIPLVSVFLTFFSLVLVSTIFGRPYSGEEDLFTQPDGSRVPLLLYGDEFYIRAGHFFS